MSVLPIRDVSHPSSYILEEMAARGWSRDRLAVEMGGDFAVNRVALDFYLDLGPEEKGLRIGDVAAGQLARAFGVSPEFWLNLEAAWLRDVENRH